MALIVLSLGNEWVQDPFQKSNALGFEIFQCEYTIRTRGETKRKLMHTLTKDFLNQIKKYFSKYFLIHLTQSQIIYDMENILQR